MKDKPNRVTVALKVVITGKFYDDDATKENLRYAVEEDLEDAGFDVDVAVLKEQEESKQIIKKQCKKEWEDGSIDYFAEWYCPHCNMLILRGFDNPSIKFCYKCGKPISWESR